MLHEKKYTGQPREMTFRRRSHKKIKEIKKVETPRDLSIEQFSACNENKSMVLFKA